MSTSKILKCLEGITSREQYIQALGVLSNVPPIEQRLAAEFFLEAALLRLLPLALQAVAEESVPEFNPERP